MNVLEFHIWGSRVDQVEKPDRIVFDLDPDVGLGFEDVRRAAFDLRDRLADIGLTTFPMLSGGKGFHLVAPLDAPRRLDAGEGLLHAFADRVGGEAPERYVANMAKAKRKGRIFVDYLRNERGSTAIAPYSTRTATTRRSPRRSPGRKRRRSPPPTSSRSPTCRSARKKIGDPWKGYFDVRQSITKAMMKKVGAE